MNYEREGDVWPCGRGGGFYLPDGHTAFFSLPSDEIVRLLLGEQQKK